MAIMNAKALVAGAVLLGCCFAAWAAGAGSSESKDGQPRWGPAKSGLQTSIGLKGKAAVAGKLVLTVDYATRQAHIGDAYAKSRAKGYVPFVTVRDLDQLTINPDHEPD